MQNNLLTTAEAARHLCVSPARVRQLVRAEALAVAGTIRGSYLFTRREVCRLARWRQGHPEAVKSTSGRFPRGSRKLNGRIVNGSG